MLFHPLCHAGGHTADLLHPVEIKRGTQLDGFGTGQDHFYSSDFVVDTGCGGQVQFGSSGQQGHPAQSFTDFIRMRILGAMGQLQLFHVNVKPVETVEQNQGVGPHFRQQSRELEQGGMVVPQFDCNR